MPKNKNKGKTKQAIRAEEWAKKRRGVNWDLVWKVLASIFAFAGSMVAVYELVNYFRSDARTFYSIIFPGLGIIVWAAILVQLFRKKNLYVIPLLAVTLLGGVVGGVGWRSYNKTREDKVAVLVAQFDGPEETYGLHDQIMEDLRQATKGYNDTIIVEGKEVITAGQGSEYARELGKKSRADLVIWAWYRPTENPNVTIHIENLSQVEFYSLQESRTYRPQTSLSELDSFVIQKKMGSDTSTLIVFLTGVLRSKAGDYHAAIERFEQIVEIKDTATFIEPFDLYGNLGYANTALRNYEQAIQDYGKAIEFNSHNAMLYSNRGVAYALLGQYTSSVENFDKAIEIDPGNALFYCNRGLSYHNLADYERAIQDYDKAIEIDKQFTQAYFNRGLTYRTLGKTAEAEADFKRYEELNGQKP